MPTVGELSDPYGTFMVNPLPLSEAVCRVCSAIGLPRFDLVTTVPAGTVERDAHQPLREIVGSAVGATKFRYQRLLRRTEVEVLPRRFSKQRFEAVRELDHPGVLLVDDTWTTGSSVQSAAYALKAAGAGPTGVVVGRHVNPGYRDNAKRLADLPGRFDWATCAREKR